MLDTTSAILQLRREDFDSVVHALGAYWTGYSYKVTQQWAKSGDAFEGFPVAPSAHAVRELDLEGRKACRLQTDVRRYFGARKPGVPDKVTGC